MTLIDFWGARAYVDYFNVSFIRLRECVELLFVNYPIVLLVCVCTL